MNKSMDKSAELKRGVIVFAVLAVLTAVEYVVGLLEAASPGLVVVLWAIAIVKAGLVLYYFMHISRVFNTGGGH